VVQPNPVAASHVRDLHEAAPGGGWEEIMTA
jgi:hypothetical protein